MSESADRDGDILVNQILAWDNELCRRDIDPVPESGRDEARC
ncbi:MAG: hypothetical protein ABSA52_10720 [Candidatus Binatia bacterium]|jgi:hypothetical protein